MMKGFFAGITFALLLVSVGVYSQSAKSTMYMGYLSDVKCATSPNGMSADGFDLTKTPESHTTACMKAAECEASGYGIFIKGANGMYAFTKFDKKGNDLAKAYLKRTKRKSGLLIDVAGMKDGDMMKVKSLQEAKVGMKMK